MLLQFNFKNYKSFKDDVTLDLTATKITEFSNHVVSIANDKVLPVSAIFGANASGKSNVYEAFRFMAMYTIFSFEYGGSTEESKVVDRTLKTTPFLFDSNSKNAESSFEIFFIDNDDPKEKTYNYGFSLDQNRITEEWLNVRAKTSKGEFKRIFYRSLTEKDLSGIPTKSRENINVALQDETLIVSLGSKLKVKELSFVRDWFLKCECTNFGNTIENYILSSMLPNNFANDRNVQKKVIKYLSAFDPSIIDFVVKKIEVDNDEYYSVMAVHKMIDSNDTESIPLKDESSGTQKMFTLYQKFHDALESGGTLFIDELNARLHPLLVRSILVMFLNPEINTNKAQLIFTTHDAWQLSNNLLRRDEIWFTDKDERGVSTLYSLADFVDEDGVKIRKDESYEKNYLLGKYGAIPSLKYLDMLLEEK